MEVDGEELALLAHAGTDQGVVEVARQRAPVLAPVEDVRRPGVISAKVRTPMQATMTEQVGVLRTAPGLAAAQAVLAELADEAGEEGTEAWETSNLVSISAALTASAALREETRGTHWREDFPARDDAGFSGHFDVVLVDGAPVVSFHPADPTDQGQA